MKAEAGELLGAVVFTPTPVADERGFFTRTFDADVARAAGVDPDALVQDSQSRTRRGVLRGMHLRSDGGEGKLVRCSRGSIFDVAVDLRPWSTTFRRWQVVLLDDVTHRAVWWPRGLAHGFQATSDVADTCYRIDRRHDPRFDIDLRWDDPELAIPWPLPVCGTSPKDAAARSLADLVPELEAWFGSA